MIGARNSPTPTIVLLTDFGTADPYAGQLRMVLASLAPGVPILDLSHEVPPFAIGTGAFLILSTLPFLPDGAILLAVVDPGVGSDRELLVVRGRCEHRTVTLLGPDNGLLFPGIRLLENYGHVRGFSLPQRNGERSATFHGRDILAPAAARLARGEEPENLGPSYALPPRAQSGFEAEAIPDGFLCRVLHVDRYGNCVLNLATATPLPGDTRLRPALVTEATGELAHYDLHKADWYAGIADGALGLIPGSQGFYELARNRGSAAGMTGLLPGDTCRLLFLADSPDMAGIWGNRC